MTTTATCAIGEVSPSPLFCSGEQYDPDLGLYYLRARYYNPATGRFMSRDSEDGQPTDPKTLHKYLYAGGDPVNAKDPTGKSALEEGVYLDIRTGLTVSEFAYALGVASGYACLADAAITIGNWAYSGHADSVIPVFCSFLALLAWR
jgi:RHS repeat-associated protein